MSTPAVAEPPEETLELHESTASSPAGIAADGRVLVHIIRPCVGKGRGRHLYTPEMLRENAHKFTGWPMYIDHESAEARKAAGGLPRKLRDVGGIIEESWWDDTVPAEGRYGQGAVVGYARPFGLAEKLIEHDPRLVETSISASATGVRPTRHQGQQVWLVEGIADQGSVDWVTQAGAGGRVVKLMEGLYEDEDGDRLDGLSDEDFIAYLDRERPQLREALANDHNEGEDMGDTITSEVLQEALRSEAAQEAIAEIVSERVAEDLPPLVEAAVASERDLIRAEAEAAADHKVDLRDWRDEAHATINEAKLPDTWKAALRSQFDISESGQPTPALDVRDVVDDESGEVVKTAREVLRESLDTVLKEQRKLLAEARPTRVTGQGPAKPATGEGGEDEKTPVGHLTGSLLQEAGIDADTAWDKV